MPKHRETTRLAEYANIIMKELFLLKLIKSFIENYYIRPALWVFTTCCAHAEVWVTRGDEGRGMLRARGCRGRPAPSRGLREEEPESAEQGSRSSGFPLPSFVWWPAGTSSTKASFSWVLRGSLPSPGCPAEAPTKLNTVSCLAG